MRLRRTRFAIYRLEGAEVRALSALTGAEVAVTEPELAALRAVPEDDWAELDPTPALGSLADKGLLIVDEGGERLDCSRQRDATLERDAWHPLAAAFHFGTKMSGVELRDPPITDGMVERFGAPPPHFKPAMGAEPPIELAAAPPARDDFERALEARRTTRFLDPTASLPSEQFSTLIARVFGVEGTYRHHPALTVLHRTSASASGLAPAEVYPIVLRVEGLQAGIYHYLADRHALELLRPAGTDELSGLLHRWAASQVHVGDAVAVFVVAARFGRTFWKYRQAARSYGVLLMELGHLSQTFYLTAAHLELGAFITTSINDWDVERALGLDSYHEGVVAMLGCGFATGAAPARPTVPGSPPFELPFEPYPR